MTTPQQNNEVENMEIKTCPKCSSRMLADKEIGSGVVETSLFNEGEFRGDDVIAYYCRKCGFIELDRIENRRLPAVTSEKELWDYSDTQE